MKKRLGKALLTLGYGMMGLSVGCLIDNLYNKLNNYSPIDNEKDAFKTDNIIDEVSFDDVKEGEKI